LGSTASGGPALTCLPQFGAWINVLGREYVELLGRDNLLALEVYEVHEDSAGRIWLQMSERPEQMHLPDVKEHVKKVIDSLNAPDVFCREPRTERERLFGVDPKEYRTPNFDWSELRDDDPFSPRPTATSVLRGKTSFQMSIGYGRQIVGKYDLAAVMNAIFDIIRRSRNVPGPFGVAYASDGEVIRITSRKASPEPLRDTSDAVMKQLAELCRQRSIKAAGVCHREKRRVPGAEAEVGAFAIHLESAAGDAYVIYLPFEEKNGKRDYGTLVVEPGERVIFADSPKPVIHE
jgi:hypothetical protein